MKRWIIGFVLLSCTLCAQQKAPTSKQSGSATVVSGATITIDNPYAALTGTFEEIPNGSPSAVSAVPKGCMKGGTCDMLNTNTATTAANIKPTISGPYDYFTLVPTLTGGTGLTVNWTLK